MKLKSYCKEKDTAIYTKQQPTEWENIVTTTHSIEDKYPKYIKKSNVRYKEDNLI